MSEALKGYDWNREGSMQDYMDFQRELIKRLEEEYGISKQEWTARGYAERFSQFAIGNNDFWHKVKENQDESVRYFIEEELKLEKKQDQAA